MKRVVCVEDHDLGRVVKWSGSTLFTVYLTEELGGYEVDAFTRYGDYRGGIPTGTQAVQFANEWLDEQEAEL